MAGPPIEANRMAVVKYFLLGNPLVYWGSTLALLYTGALVVFYLIRWQRGYPDLTMNDIDHIHYAGIYPVIGWFLHYMPFLIMARVTYVHHYYPALWFAIISAGFCVDWTTRNWRKDIQWGLYVALYAATIGLYWYFRAISFGMVGDSAQWKHLKWLQTWRMTE